jgi:hypothetical protein
MPEIDAGLWWTECFHSTASVLRACGRTVDMLTLRKIRIMKLGRTKQNVLETHVCFSIQRLSKTSKTTERAPVSF